MVSGRKKYPAENAASQGPVSFKHSQEPRCNCPGAVGYCRVYRMQKTLCALVPQPCHAYTCYRCLHLLLVVMVLHACRDAENPGCSTELNLKHAMLCYAWTSTCYSEVGTSLCHSTHSYVTDQTKLQCFRACHMLPVPLHIRPIKAKNPEHNVLG